MRIGIPISKAEKSRKAYLCITNLKLSNHKEKTSSRGCRTAAAVTGLAAYEKSNVSDLLNANVEALAREESGRCTGPKSDDAICKCRNQNSCLDDHGCQW